MHTLSTGFRKKKKSFSSVEGIQSYKLEKTIEEKWEEKQTKKTILRILENVYQYPFIERGQKSAW